MAKDTGETPRVGTDRAGESAGPGRRFSPAQEYRRPTAVARLDRDTTGRLDAQQASGSDDRDTACHHRGSISRETAAGARAGIVHEIRALPETPVPAASTIPVPAAFSRSR